MNHHQFTRKTGNMRDDRFLQAAWCSGNHLVCESRACIHVLAPTLPCSVASASSFLLSGPQFPFLENGDRCVGLGFFFFLFCFVCFFLGPHPWHMEVPRLGIRVRAAAASHSHSDTRSEPYLQPKPQLVAVLDP